MRARRRHGLLNVMQEDASRHYGNAFMKKT